MIRGDLQVIQVRKGFCELGEGILRLLSVECRRCLLGHHLQPFLLGLCLLSRSLLALSRSLLALSRSLL